MARQQGSAKVKPENQSNNPGIQVELDTPTTGFRQGLVAQDETLNEAFSQKVPHEVSQHHQGLFHFSGLLHLYVR